MVISALKQVANAATNAVHSATSAGHSHSSTSGTFSNSSYTLCGDTARSGLTINFRWDGSVAASGSREDCQGICCWIYKRFSFFVFCFFFLIWG